MAADLTQKQYNFVARVNNGIVAFLDAHDDLIDLVAEYNALNYGDPTAGITDEILASSSSPHLDRDAFMAGFTTISAVNDLFASGHATNLQRFRR